MHLAIDLGAESGRIVVGDLGRMEVIHRFPTPRLRLAGGLYWDALGIFAETRKGMMEAFSRHGTEIVSVGVDSWAVDYALLDAQGELLGNPFHYRDARNEGIMDQVRRELGDWRIYSRTGIQFLPFNTMYQLREEVVNRPERLGCARSFLTIPDLINYWLCGRKANEYSNATSTQLLDPRSRDWAWDLIDELGIPRRIFQEIVPSGTVLGELEEWLRLDLGAPRGVKVVAPACHDTGSAVAALPSVGSRDQAYLSSGTWSLLGVELDEALINEESMRANFTNEGSAQGGSRFLKNIMGLWILQECLRDWKRQGRELDYAELVGLASQAESTGVQVDVDDPVFLRPGEADDRMSLRLVSSCLGQGYRLGEDPAVLTRLILESLAASYARNIQELRRLTGRAIEEVIVIGGGSRNELLCKLSAKAAGIPFLAGPSEATSLGNILVQALALGHVASLEEGRRLISSRNPLRRFEP